MSARRPSFLPLLLLAAACAAPDPVEDELALAEEDVAGAVLEGGKADVAGWETAPTLHVGEERFDRAGVNGRRVHAVWADGRPGAPIPLDVTVTADEGGSARVAVLGPLRANGTRAVLASAGYARPLRSVRVTPRLTASGQHLVVVGTFDLASESGYRVLARCGGSGCSAGRVDALASPKAGALVGRAGRLVSMTLGPALANRGRDVEVEVLASPPMLRWLAEPVAVAVASGTQVNVLLPASVRAGDDLVLVVRDPSGAVHDTGVEVRYAPAAQPFARVDAVLYGDLASVDVAGVTGYFEGGAELALRSETHRREIHRVTVRATRPGQATNGLAAFDAAFTPELVLPGGALNPVLPRNGELLSVGRILGDGSFTRLGCFEYCNDLSGMETCTGGARACPAP
jgi:hypothetical protein